MVPTMATETYVARHRAVGPIFDTVTKGGRSVSVAIEPIRNGHAVVIRHGGRPILAVPVQHATHAIVGSLLDAIDSNAVMARVGELA
jgi:hypothetical protein